MSVKIMAMVYECALPRDEKTILLAYADHADHEGNNIYPSIGLMVWKTGYKVRAVQLITKELVDKKILVKVGETEFGVNEYYIDIDALPTREPYRAKKRGRPNKTDDILTPDSLDEKEMGAKNAPDSLDEKEMGAVYDEMGANSAPGGAVSAKPGANLSINDVEKCTLTINNHPINPSFNHNNPVIFSPSSSSTIQGQGGGPDLMQPVGKVPRSEPPADPASVPAPGPAAEKAWEALLYEMQASRMVSKSIWDQFIVNFKPVSLQDGHLAVWVPNEYAKAWFDSRMQSWALRQLHGICNRDDVRISVITPEAAGARP